MPGSSLIELAVLGLKKANAIGYLPLSRAEVN
jgi:hypothetical protein